MADKEINIVVKAIDQATGGLKKVGTDISGRAKKNEARFQGMAVAGGVAFGAITAIAKKSIDAFAESEAQLARVDQAIRNIDLKKMGTSFDEASKSARDFGSNLQKTVGISDEAGAESFAKLLAITKDYTEAQKMATLAADLSVAKQMDMNSATKLVAMAMAGNVKILKEYGIEVDENASKQEIMGAIMEKVGGQADAFGKTTAGQMAILKESFGDVQEAIGGALAPALNSLLSIIQPVITKVSEWILANPKLSGQIIMIVGAVTGLIAIIGGLGLIIPSIVAGFGFITTAVSALGTALSFLALNPIGLVIMAIGALILAGVTLYQHWDDVKRAVGELGNYLSIIRTNIQTKITTTITNIKTTVSGIWNSMLDGMKSSVTSVFDWITSRFDAIVNTVSNAVSRLKSLWASATSGGSSSGKRALGGTVQAGKTYMVGERGPEMFTPATTGSIDNKPSSGGVNISINMGGVQVSKEADEDRLVDKIKNTLAREMQLYKLGIN